MRRSGSGLAAELTSIIRGTQWTLVFSAFLVYIFVILTYRLPLGDVAVAAALVGLILQKDRLRIPPLLVWFVVFVGWAAVGYTQTDWPDTVWQTGIDLAKLWLITLAGVNALRSRGQIRLFMIFVVALFAMFPIRGAIFNYVFYHNTVLGRAVWNYIYSNPNDLAAIIILMLSIAVALLVSEQRGWVRKGALAAAFVLPFVILMTQSRGGFIGLAVGVAIAVMSQRRKGHTILAVAALTVVLGVFAPAGAWERLGGIGKATRVSRLEEADPEGSAAARFAIWETAVRIIGDQPFRGVGVGAYAAANYEYTVGDQEINAGARGRKDTHSTYLNVLAETGLPGFAFFIAMILSVVVPVERIRRRYRYADPSTAGQLFYLQLGLLGFLVAGLFGSFARISFLYLQLVLIWALAQTMLPSRAPRRGRVPTRRGQRAPKRRSSRQPRRPIPADS
jgi:probable O-glycosylation ligase (exosortase A-associated)